MQSVQTRLLMSYDSVNTFAFASVIILRLKRLLKS